MVPLEVELPDECPRLSPGRATTAAVRVNMILLTVIAGNPSAASLIQIL